VAGSDAAFRKLSRRVASPAKEYLAVSKIRVLHTLGWIHSGGVEQLRVLMARGLGSDRYAHAIICQKANGPIPEVLRGAGWDVHEIGLAPRILDLGWHRRAHAIAQQFRPDIIHGAVYEGEALAWSTGLRMPRAKVVMEETSDPVDRRWTGNMLMRLMCARADACVGVSPRVVDYLRHTLRIPKHKLRLISNAVAEVPPPTGERLKDLRLSLGIAEDDVIIGAVGRLEDACKRYSDIITALKHVRKTEARARLLIVGDGKDAPALRQLVADLDLEDAVIFAGYQGNTRDFYHLMDVFVLASTKESFGLVLVEAMLAEVPVVATRVGGIPFVLDEGRAGVLVRPEHPGELSSAILELLASPSATPAHTAAGLDRARTAFSPARYIQDVENLYAELLSGQGASR
jgi:glycosyltransferase involved in cell wall biosynthesis